eukprot:CAMPEP_0181319552 /NCGR_PEP_ID=MMETSP1101-20121128/17636_1 /TAXON_ID=46948 /ORGANISM="Rhodomonas abbreviata, Strain Caron Lab Isolate" /LENGTH=81 /DNA_ID=CAMNT_0023427167 /DNA_START=27 /DNA_END=272 /DNA_ORIENTATION=+
MEDEKGNSVELYFPRSCSYTNRLIAAKDKGAVQISIANVDEETGIMTGQNTVFAFCGYIRGKGEADMALTELAKTVPGAEI